jgi:cation diffusion facilitator family transporter
MDQLGIIVSKNTPAARVDQENRLIGRTAFCAFLLNLGLAVLKGVLAFHSNSLAVTAGAIDSGTDAAASLVLYGGLKLSTRKTPSFPLGLYKIENVISVFVSLSILFAGYEIAREILAAAASPTEISLSVVILLLICVVATYLFGRYAMSAGRKTESPTLIAEARHRQVDVLSSIVVLGSVLPAYLGWDDVIFGVSIDQIAAAVVLIFIGRAGWSLLSDGMRVLLDASVDFETLNRVRDILAHHPMVAKVQSLTGRNAGRFRFLQASIIIRTGDLQKAHQISEGLQVEIRENVPHVERVMIQYEPQPRTHSRIAVPLTDPAGTISDHFGESPYFAFVTLRLSDGLVEEQEVIANPHRDVETAKGIRVAEWLVQHKADQVFIKEDLSHKGPAYVFGQAGVIMEKTAVGQLAEILPDLKVDKSGDRVLKQ